MICHFLDNLTLMDWRNPGSLVSFKNGKTYKIPDKWGIELNKQGFCWIVEKIV